MGDSEYASPVHVKTAKQPFYASHVNHFVKIKKDVFNWVGSIFFLLINLFYCLCLPAGLSETNFATIKSAEH